MAEIWVERQNWARWPRVLNVNRHTDHGTETRRYLPERPWSEREYAVGKIAELKAENEKLREFASDAFSMAFNFYHGAGTAEDLRELKVEYHELGIEVDENDGTGR